VSDLQVFIITIVYVLILLFIAVIARICQRMDRAKIRSLRKALEEGDHAFQYAIDMGKDMRTRAMQELDAADTAVPSERRAALARVRETLGGSK
jgi:hypothetical protein